ncbi:fluoride efflux transporter CrcB [Rheinheimera baltica]|uniref:Fluoride-specific ion channel FluC n=1 Tax=Rheinheimera baltica TaxID=67576 RepID=A0ABT9HW64_9GAMM|nr:fluoride efflux transporter CrcB [Rheinheimera baltica]MDP5135369.1 fluoride efflux transporter CrcB [Rheinheimera baltica]MDP5144559.1 fluoride efflux transporter CrcB [Rheinheimera baltica]MDP5191502.1 fluoride efflux transporter CrcB [Rheinheimera baltica]
MLTYVAVAIGGAVGACLRYATNELALNVFGKAFPFGTLVVNILGSFVLGLLYALLSNGVLAVSPWRALVTIGLIGAFTTFSTFSLDTVLLLQQGDWLKAIANVLLNVLLCLTLAWLGLKLGSMK